MMETVFQAHSIHAGKLPDPYSGARAIPICQTSSFSFSFIDNTTALFGHEQAGNFYLRSMNPTAGAWEKRLAVYPATGTGRVNRQ